MAKDKNVRMFFGDDDFRVTQAAAATLREWVPEENRALCMETVDGALDTADEVGNALDKCREALLTPAFFGMVKTVWLRDVVFLEKHPALGVPAVKERLRRLAEWITAAGNETGVRLLVTAAGVDKRTAFYIACKKAATIREFAVPQRTKQAEQYALQQLAGLLRERGLRAAPDVMLAIVERTGADTRQLANETDKLRDYLGGNAVVTAEAVRDLVPASRQSIVWEFTDTVGKKDLPGSLQVLRRLLFQKETPVGLLGMLERFVRELILYRHAVEQRWLRRTDPQGVTVAWTAVPENVETLFGGAMERDPRSANPYRMGILARTAAAFSLDVLHHWRILIVQTYRRMFSGNIPPERHLELLLLRMLGASSRVAKQNTARNRRNG